MEVVTPAYRPVPTMDTTEMKDQQRNIAAAAAFHTQCPISAADVTIDELVSVQGAETTQDRTAGLVAGIDQAFRDGYAVSAVVVIQDGTIVAQSTAETKVTIPYIPGLLAYREANPIIAALDNLAVDPDLVLLDGSGRIHYRQAGIATHIGVLYDVATIGVAKNLLCGTPVEPIADPLPTGSRIPIEADDEVEAIVTDDNDWPVIGCAFQSRQFDNPDRRHVNPVYVSPGHRTSVEFAVDIVSATCAGRKLPEPIRIADRVADQIVTED